MSNLKFLISYSYLITCWVFVAVALSSLTLANQRRTSVDHSSEQNQDHTAFEGNATLQELVRAKYGVNIQKLLDYYSHENDTDTDVPLPHYNITPPEWQPKLLVHLVKDEIQKSNETLKFRPETFVDDGRWYLELSLTIKSMALHDELFCINVNSTPGIFVLRYRELGKRTDNFTFWMVIPLFEWYNRTSMYCMGEFYINGTKHLVYSEIIPIVFQTVVEEPVNVVGPWVWPSAPVIMYNKSTLVELDCWAWLHMNNTLTWYVIQGNNKKEMATVKQTFKWAYVKKEFSKIIDSSDNGSVIVCDVTPGPRRKRFYAPPRNITLLYNGPIEDKQDPNLKDFVTEECKNLVMLGWGMLALLALSAVVALATYIVLVAIEPDKKKPQTEDRNIPNA